MRFDDKHPPYVPGHGDTRYSVESYNLRLDYKISTNRLSGVATLGILALEPLTSFTLDLHELNVHEVKVGGRNVQYRHQQRKITVTLREKLKQGARISVEVHYAGKPQPIPGPDGSVGWEELTDGAFVLSQPHGSPSWFPCNDRPDDKATYRLKITVDKDYAVVANGVLVAKDKERGKVSWTYTHDMPMAPYLATVQIGRYGSHSLPCHVPMRVIAPRDVKIRPSSSFHYLPAMMEAYEEMFGPYPFRGYNVVITDDELEIPLEAQALATFGRNHVAGGWGNERLVAHELSHQWFGNSLTIKRWHDIWLHEGFACYSEWLWSEASGKDRVEKHVQHHYSRLANLPQDIKVGAPGRKDMFDDRVYKRGALALHTLRQELGDKAFFAMLQSWTAQHIHGTITTPMFVEHVNAHARGDISDILRPWLYDTALPSLSKASHRGR